MPVSYLSKQPTLTNYVAPFSLDVAQKSLIYKQNQYDQGVAQTQATLDKLGSVEVYADSDKEYLKNKMSYLTENVNKLSGMDFGDRNVLSQIGQLSQVISGDERIINAVSDTAKITSLMKSASELDKAGKYSIANKKADEKQIQQYLSEKSDLAKSKDVRYTGSSTATPHFNQDKWSLDWATKIGQAKAKESREIIDPATGYKVKISGVSAQELTDDIRRIAPPEVIKQLEIDAAYKYENASRESLMKEAQNQLDISNRDYLNNIEKVKMQYQSLPVGSKPREEMEEKYKKLTTDRDFLVVENAKKFGTYTDEQLKTFVHSNEFFNGVGTSFSNLTESSTLDPGVAFNYRMQVEKRNFDFKVQNRAEDVIYREREFALKEAKVAGSKAAKEQEMGISSDPVLSTVEKENNQVNYTDFRASRENLEDTQRQVSSQYIMSFLKQNDTKTYDSIRSKFGGNVFDGNKLKPEVATALKDTKIGNNLEQIVQTAKTNRDALLDGKPVADHPISAEQLGMLNELSMHETSLKAWDDINAKVSNKAVSALQAKYDKFDVPVKKLASDVNLIVRVESVAPLGFFETNSRQLTREDVMEKKIPITEAQRIEYNKIRKGYPSSTAKDLVAEKERAYTNDISTSFALPVQGVDAKSIDKTTRGFLSGRSDNLIVRDKTTKEPIKIDLSSGDYEVNRLTFAQSKYLGKDKNWMDVTVSLPTGKDGKKEDHTVQIKITDEMLNSDSFYGGKFKKTQDNAIVDDLQHTSESNPISFRLADGGVIGFKYFHEGGNKVGVRLMLDSKRTVGLNIGADTPSEMNKKIQWILNSLQSDPKNKREDIIKGIIHSN